MQNSNPVTAKKMKSFAAKLLKRPPNKVGGLVFLCLDNIEKTHRNEATQKQIPTVNLVVAERGYRINGAQRVKEHSELTV